MEKYFSKIITAVNGIDAWEIFKKEPEIQIVVTDVDMPKMNGAELTNNILNIRPVTQIIIVTGFINDELALYSAKQNIAYLPKPVDPSFVAFAATSGFSRYKNQLWQENLKELFNKIGFFIITVIFSSSYHGIKG